MLNLPEGRYPVTIPLKNGTLKARFRLAWRLLRGRPVLYRVGIINGNVYLPETMFMEQVHITDSNIQKLDKKGYPPTYKPFWPK